MKNIFSLKTILNENTSSEPMSDADIKRLQQCLIECCREVLEVCDKHGIKLILVGGSLLGYVRHNGFIPWDDDVDFGLMREDYEKFIEVFDEELSDRYIMSAPKEGYPSYNRFVQIFRKGTVLRGEHVDTDGRPQTVYIDIFPLDYTPQSKFVRQLKGLRSNALMGIGGCVQGAAYMSEAEKETMCKTSNGKALYMVRSAVGKAFSWRSPKKWFETIDRQLPGLHESGFITIATGRKHYLGEVIPADSVLPLQKVSFEGLELYAPRNPDLYLTNLYGDYMVIPPEDKRERHFAVELEVL